MPWAIWFDLGFDVLVLTAYMQQVSSLQYHLVRFKMPAVMAFQIGAKVVSFSAASRKVSRNLMVRKTQEMVGTHSEENTC